MKHIAGYVLLCGGLIVANAVLAGELLTKVKHIAVDAIYLDAGRDDGIQVGDRVTIRRDGTIIAYYEVLFVSAGSASCRLLESRGPVQVGDEAVVITQTTAKAPSETDISDIVPPAGTTIPKKKSSVTTNRITGRLALSSQWDNDLEATNSDAAEPSLAAKLRVDHLGGSTLRLEFKARVRRLIRHRETAAATQSQWNNRLYEAALVSDDPADKISFRAGRFVANSIAGIGYLDGALGHYKLNGDWQAGAFLGADPDLRNTDFRGNRLKSGLFVRLEKARNSESQLAGTLALAATYRDGEASREFLYQQITVAPHRTLNVYESAELNINREWREQADGSLLLSSFTFSARWNPHKHFSADLGYDNRRNFHSFETRSVADSLFDDALRQSIRAVARVKIAGTFYARTGAGLRALAGDWSHAGNTSAALGATNLANSGTGIELTAANYESGYSSGTQLSAYIRKSFLSSLQTTAIVGQDRYKIKTVNANISQSWLRVSGDLNFSRHTYGSLETEFRRGDGVDANYYFAELGYRF